MPVPGLTEHAVGFKSLADAIWLRNHVVETLESANATEDPERQEELLTYVFVGGGYAGLEALAELQDFAADAIESYPRARLRGMRWVLVEATDRVLPEIDLALAYYALRRAARARHRHPPRHHPGAGRGRQRPALHRRDPAHPDGRLDRRGGAEPEPAASQRPPRSSAAGSRSTSTCGSRAWTRSGRSAIAPPRRRPGAGSARRPPSTPSARARWPPATSPPRSASARPGPTGTGPRRRSSTSAATRRSAGSATAPSAASRPGGWRGPTT